jgi:uroporphyrin-III C-methyltransferase
MNKLVQIGRTKLIAATMIYNSTLATQRTVAGTLCTLASVTSDIVDDGPAVIVVGDVVRLREKMRWFQEQFAQKEDVWTAIS